jgi:hypothetical protein
VELKPRRDATSKPKQRAVKNLREPKRQLTEWDRNFIEPAEAIECQDHGVYDVQVALKAKQLGLPPET